MAGQDVSAGPIATGPRPQRVVIITGASQGIGAALVDAYRKLNYSVVANSRTITAADDPAWPRSWGTSPIPRRPTAS